MAYLTDEEIDQRILAQGQTFDRQPASGRLAQIGQATNIRRPSWMPPEVTKAPESTERTFGGTVADVGVSLGKGVVGTGQAAIGLADMVTPGQLGKGLENIGVDLGAAQEYLAEKYSPAQKAAFKKVEDVKGFLPTLGAMTQNPSTIVHSVVESLPAIAGGGLVGRGALALAPRIGGLAAGAIGEGAVTAGQTSEGIRAQSDDREITGKQSLMALGAGAGTGLIGGLSGKIAGNLARKLGINLADIDTFAATGKLGDAAKKLAEKGKFTDNVAARIVAGGVSEGVFEELPQSVQEQVWMNAATGKDLKEGLGEAAAAGLLAGTAMGGGMNVFSSGTQQEIKKSTRKQLTDVDKKILTLESLSESQKTEESQKNINDLYQQRDVLLREVRGIDQNQDQTIQEEIKLPINLDEINQQIENLEQSGATNPGSVNLLNQLYEQKDLISNQIFDTEITKRGEDVQREAKRLGARPEPIEMTQDEILWQQNREDRQAQIAVLMDETLPQTPEETIKIAEQLQQDLQFLDKEKTDLDTKAENIAKQRQVRDIDNELKNIIAQQDQIENKNSKEFIELDDQRRGLNNQLAEIFTDTDRVMAGRFQRDFKIDRIERAKTEGDVPNEEALSTQPDVGPVVGQGEPTVEEVGRVEEPAIAETPTTEPEQAIQDQDAIREDYQAREALISDMESELEENKREQARLGDNDPMREELRLDAEELQGQIQEGNRELLVDRLSAGPDAQFETRSDTKPGQGIALPEIQKMYKNQDVTQTEDGTISVRFDNGKGATIQSIQDAGNGFIQMAIATGQMSKAGKILGVTTGNNILLDSEFADKKTAWHENEHVLENLGMIRAGDISALNKEFNKLRRSENLDFVLSTHEDPKQAMAENRANMFAQVMVNREAYSDSTFNAMIQRVMDFFNSLYVHGRRFVTGSDYQNMRGLASEVESGRIYGREPGEQTEAKEANWDKKYPKINFEVRDRLGIPEQTIPEAEYAENRKQHRDLVGKTKQALKSTGRSLNRTLNKYLGVTSTNLLKIHPMLQAKAKKLDFDTIKRIQKNIAVATPVLEKMSKMSKNDKADFDWAVKNGDFGKVMSLAQSYDFIPQYQALRDMMDTIHKDLKDVGYRPGYVENYWPRVNKDYEGYLLATKEISQEPIFTKALEQQAKKLGTTVAELSPDIRANIIAQKIAEVKAGIGGPGNIHQRVYDKIPIDLGKYYAGASASLINYIYSTAKNIEGRKFFGKVPTKIKNAREIIFNKTNEIKVLEEQKASLITNGQDTTELDNQIASKQDYIEDHQKKLEEYGQEGEFKDDIGSYIDELMVAKVIKPEDEKTLKDILEARFYEHGTTGKANVFKNLSLIDTMGSPLSAITQIQDLGFSVYVGGLTPRGITNSVKNIGKALAKRSDIKKEDLGLEWISQEFADPDTLSRAVNKIFKLTKLDRMDAIGKEVLVNNAYDNYRVKAENKDKLFKEIRHMFNSDKETNEVIQDLRNNVKDSHNVQFLVFSRLLDFQPATKSEMAEKALTLGNWRLAYLLKSFTIKQIDVFRRDVWHKLKEGIKTNNKTMIADGIKNMGMLLGLLSVAGAGADELKDLILGKDIKFEDHFIEQLASLGGANRYLRMQVRKEGAGTALGKQILPPFKFIDAITKDTAQNTWDLDSARWVDSVPLAGKIYSWRMGRAAQYRSSSEDKDFKKDSKEFRKFDKEFEESNDKRLYLRSNLEMFKQKKLYDNFSKALRGNKKTIAKLKDIEQTTNVRRRLGQLEQQRKTLINRYFEMKNNLN